MQTHGYRIIPINPNIDDALGEKSYASLSEVPHKIDIVNIFRRPEYVEEIVERAIQLKIPAIWMQEDVIHEKAAQKARAAGIFVVMDKCILKEHRDAISLIFIALRGFAAPGTPHRFHPLANSLFYPFLGGMVINTPTKVIGQTLHIGDLILQIVRVLISLPIA